MKKLLYISLAALWITACSTGKGNDKKAELESLKKQESELRDKIIKLQEDIAKTDTSVDSKSRQVEITSIVAENFQHMIEVQAKVDGDENVMISPDMPGTIVRVNVKAGDRVSKGTVLVELDNQVYQKNLEELLNARDFTNTLYQKQKALWDQKIGSEVQYLTAKNNLESMDKKIATVREQLNLSKVKSPINGTVDQVNVKLGEMYSPGMPGLRVVNFASLKVKAEVAEAYISKVKKGDKVEVEFPDLNKKIMATLSYSGKVIDPVNRTFGVEVSVNEKDADLHPNMIAVLRIADYSSPNAVILPINVVQTTPAGSYVFVAQGNKAVKRTVVTGHNYRGKLEINSGLNAGDKVVTTGFQDLVDGQSIKF
ncbi:efflux RND transporter periplasmic adaptor subunit [soil metagenome]